MTSCSNARGTPGWYFYTSWDVESINVFHEIGDCASTLTRILILKLLISTTEECFSHRCSELFFGNDLTKLHSGRSLTKSQWITFLCHTSTANHRVNAVIYMYAKDYLQNTFIFFLWNFAFFESTFFFYQNVTLKMHIRHFHVLFLLIESDGYDENRFQHHGTGRRISMLFETELF